MIFVRAFAIATLGTLFAAGACIALDENSKKYDQLGEISGAALQAIETAKPEFLKENPQPSAYTVGMIETDHLYQVSFCLKSQMQVVKFIDGDKEGTTKIGFWTRCPGSLTVEMDKSFKILDKRHNRD